MNLYYNDFFEDFQVPTSRWGEGILSGYTLSARWNVDGWKSNLIHQMDMNNRVISVKNSSVYLPEKDIRNEWFEFYISSFYGNCGLCIISCLSYGSYALAKEALDYAIYLCEGMGYSQALYSVYDGQKDHIKLLTDVGFVKLEGSEMLNQRSDNVISIYTKELSPVGNTDDWDDDEDEDNDY